MRSRRPTSTPPATRPILSLLACLLVLLAGAWGVGRSAARGQTCCGFSGNCYQPGPFGSCGSDPDIGNVACTPNPCVGRCCNLTTGACSVGVPGNSFGAPSCNGGTGGFTFGATTCAGNPCPASGACCLGNGSCSILTSSACGANVYQGNNTVCGASPCTGACCDTTTGACTVTGFTGCSGGGQFNGLGTACSTGLCSGACCNTTTGGCSITGTAGCAGSFVGLGSTCGLGTCPQPGACCQAATFTCSSVTATFCAGTGTFAGVGTTCTPSPCATPAMPNAFSYQGRLTGGPSSGTIATRFTLWDHVTSTASFNRVAGPTTVGGVSLSSSLFTAVVDFGQRLPTDRKSWLQIEVDTGSGFVSLTPRQLMTFAPIAGHAAAAAVAGTRSQTLCLGPGSFVGLDSSKRLFNSYVDGVYSAVVGADEIVAPVNLPDGAQIDSIRAYVRDTVAENLQFQLVTKNLGGPSSAFITGFTAFGSSGYFSQTISTAIVINGQAVYSLRAFPDPSSGTFQWPGNSTLAVQNVVITWHMP